MNLIERQAAIDALDAIDDLPSAEPIRMKGNLVERREWIPGYQNRWYRKIFSCSECGADIAMESWDEHRCFGNSTVLRDNIMPNFCPNCGADMRG